MHDAHTGRGAGAETRSLALGVGLIPYSPLNAGQLDAYEQLCREVGGSLPR